MGEIRKAMAFAMYMVVVYHALSSHDERPVMVSRPTKDRDEANDLANGLKDGLGDGYKVHVCGVNGGQALEQIFTTLEGAKISADKPQGMPLEPC